MNKVFVAGHNGMVGSAICRELDSRGIEIYKKSKSDLDLRREIQVYPYLFSIKPDAVIIAAAKVGGIHANNTYPADFLYDNLLIASNLIRASYLCGVKKLIFLGSSCIYPKFASQPIKESELLTSSLEPTNEAYAIAKIAGLKLCQYYRKQYGVDYHSIMPCNLYGIGDNYHPENSHVLPALIRRFHEAKINNSKEVVVWGTGTPLREFLYADDLAKVVVNSLFLKDMPDWVNAGSNFEYSISELVKFVKDVVGFSGELVFDINKPDGTPRKKMDNSLLNSLMEVKYTPFIGGLESSYKDFLRRYEKDYI
jgi:GDP-L-fucose synthase